MAPILDEINEIQSNFDDARRFNHGLAGNIEHEYGMAKSFEHIEQLMSPMAYNFIDHFGFETSQTLNTEGTPRVKMRSLWVNFQRKGEFNPHHIHHGALSFVIWVKVPYLMEDEFALMPYIQNKERKPGHFTFTYTDALGRVMPCNFPVDKTWENKAILFPAQLPHLVYPFQSSDDYRISISGNFTIDYE